MVGLLQRDIHFYLLRDRIAPPAACVTQSINQIDSRRICRTTMKPSGRINSSSMGAIRPHVRIASRSWRCPQCRRHASSQVQQPAAGIPSTEEIASARRFCLDMLRKYDTPSSLLLPYIPRHARDAYIALRVFNIEVARTADTTSTPTIGAMRLQFQRDAVSKALAGTPPKQPVAILLAEAAQQLYERTAGKSRFSKSWLMRIIDARENDLDNRPYPTLESLESYAENTYSTLLYLTLQALPVASLTADHVASHIGKAYGIAAVLRGLPLRAFPNPANSHSGPGQFAGDGARQGSVVLPLDIMAETGVREEDVLRNGSSARGLKDAVFQVATRASDHLITARQMMENIRAGQDAGHQFEHQHEEEHAHLQLDNDGRGESPAQELQRGFGVFMPAVATQLWLDRLQQHDFDVFSPKLRVTDWKLPWNAFWAWNRKRI